MQESWLTYCCIQRQNYLCDKLGFYFLDFFMSQYPLLFVDSIYYSFKFMFQFTEEYRSIFYFKNLDANLMDYSYFDGMPK